MVEAVFLLALAVPSQIEDPAVLRRVHDVRALLEPEPAERRDRPGIPWPSAGGPLVQSSWRGGQVCHDEPLQWSPVSIVEVVRAALPPVLLADAGVSFESADHEITSVGKPALHDAVAEVLRRIGSTIGAPVTVEVALVPPASLPTPLPEGPFFPPADFDACLARAGKDGQRFLLRTASGHPTLSHSGRVLEVLADTEVNQTGVKPVANPLKDFHRLGTTIEVEALLVGPDGLRLDLHATRLSTAGDAVVRKTHYADLELQPLEERTLRTTLFLPFGRAALAGSFVERGEDGKPRELAVLVRAQPAAATTEPAPADPTPAAAEPRDEDALLLHDLSFLTEALPGEKQPLLDSAVVRDLLRQEIQPRAWVEEESLTIAAGRFLVGRAAPEVIADARKWLAARVERRARQAQVLLEVFEGPWEAILSLRAAAAGGLELPEGWREAAAAKITAVLRTELRGLAGARLAARGVSARPFVSDVSTVSGGTGFTIIAMPDPVMDRAGDGFDAWAAVRETARPDGIELQFDLALAKTAFPETVPVPVPISKELPGEGGVPRSPGSLQPPWTWTAYPVDLPRQSAFRVRETAALRQAKATVLRVQESAAGRGWALVATARVVATLGEGR